MSDNDLSIEIHEASRTAADVALAQRVAETLLRYYPGHLWGVYVGGGVITVKNLGLSGEWGFLLHMNKIHSASDLDRKLRRAGGEILERYAMPREAMTVEKIVTRLGELPEDYSGRLRFDK